MPNVGIGEIWIFAILLLTLYMLPTLIAHSRSAASRGAITVLNIFLGWTAICVDCVLGASIRPHRIERTQVNTR